MVSNALAGAAVGYSLGLTPDEIRRGIETLPSMPGRNNIISTEKFVLLDDCYNANPVSMKAAIDVLTMAIGRKVAILGDMTELGEDAHALHYETGKYAAAQDIDLVCGIGTLAKELVRGAQEVFNRKPAPKSSDAEPTDTEDIVTESVTSRAVWFETKADFLARASLLLKDGDNILIKASHGMNFPEIVEHLK